MILNPEIVPPEMQQIAPESDTLRPANVDEWGEVDNADEPDSLLTPRQVKVMELLISGKTVSSSAAETSTNRSTIYRWLKDDRNFRMRYNEECKALLEAASLRVLSMGQLAADVVSQAMTEKRDVSVAMKILDSTGATEGKASAYSFHNPLMRR